MANEIWMAAAEASPFAQTGGLGEIMRSLPAALARQGLGVRRFLPAYGFVPRQGFRKEAAYDVPCGDGTLPAEFISKKEPSGVITTLVVCDELFKRPTIYGPPGEAYPDNAKRFAFFSHAIVHFAHESELPSVLHAHDWPAALIPVFVRFGYTWKSAPRTVFTVHNMAYQGQFPSGELKWFGLGEDSLRDLHRPEGMEYFGDINFLKAGLTFADRLLTVSPTYAKEIQTPEYGCGLEGLVCDRARSLEGILNGIDGDIWNPSADEYLPVQYDASKFLRAREAAQRVLREAFEIKVSKRPVVGMVGRLAHQKGFDLVLESAVRLLALGTDLCIVGDGDPSLADQFKKLHDHLPGRIGVKIRFDERLAHLVVAGSDIVILPSRYEPCGLTQMYATHYGTVPVAHKTGGFVDTVDDVTKSPKTGTGFLFSPLDPDRLLATVKKALEMMSDKPEAWREMQKRGMKKDFSWSRAAKRHTEIYRDLGGENYSSRGKSAVIEPAVVR